MQRFLTGFLAVLLALCMPFSAAAAEKLTPEQTSAQVEQKAVELEKKYDIRIGYPSDRDGLAKIPVSTLETLDMALENVTPGLVRQVSEYYRQKNGARLSINYVQRTDNLVESSEGIEATLGAFDNTRSLIEMYLPGGSSPVVMTGEAPIQIVHEFGHALHFLYTDQYGFDKMKKEWSAFNQGESYDRQNIMQNPNDKVFVSGYAATMFEEDVAETIGHVFARAKAGQGLKSKLTSGGKQTGLGKKVAYVEKMLSAYLTDTKDAVANYRRIYKTATSVTYQNMQFSGEYLQFAGYAQPRYILNGTLSRLGKEKSRAVWIRSIGGWYVREPDGEELIVFPGYVWTKVPTGFKAPGAAA